MKKFFMGSCILMLSSQVHAFSLQETANSMSAKTWIDITDETNYKNSNMSDSSEPLFYWANSGNWDPVDKKIMWVGNPGSCCGDHLYRLMTFDEGTNTWDLQATGHSGSGHAYDSNAFDPISGTLFYAKRRAEVLDFSKRGDLNNWDRDSMAELPDSHIVPAISWFPEAYNGEGALIYFDRGMLFANRGGNTTWEDIYPSDGISGSYNKFIEYNPVHKIILLGGGDDHAMYKMDSDFNVTRLKDAPFSVSTGDAIISVDGFSGKYLVLKGSKIYEYDILNDDWGANYSIDSMSYSYMVPINEYGVVMIVSYNKVLLYKHSDGVSEVNRIAPSIPLELTVD